MPKDHVSYKRSCGVCSGVRKNINVFIEQTKSIWEYDWDIINNKDRSNVL